MILSAATDYCISYKIPNYNIQIEIQIISRKLVSARYYYSKRLRLTTHVIFMFPHHVMLILLVFTQKNILHQDAADIFGCIDSIVKYEAYCRTKYSFCECIPTSDVFPECTVRLLIQLISHCQQRVKKVGLPQLEWRFSCQRTHYPSPQ